MSYRGNSKPNLPHGWTVQQSKSFPDRIYYFNQQTGATTWDMPDLVKDVNLPQNLNVRKDIKKPVSAKKSISKEHQNLDVRKRNQLLSPVNQSSNNAKNSSVNFQIPLEAKFSPVEFSDEDYDSFDLVVGSGPSDNSHPVTPTSLYNGGQLQSEIRHDLKSSVVGNTSPGISKADNVQFREYYDKSGHVFKPSSQEVKSSAGSVRSTSSSVENLKRQQHTSQDHGNPPSKKLRLSGSDCLGPTSRYVLGGTDNLNYKYPLADRLNPVPNPPDILVGTGTYAMRDGLSSPHYSSIYSSGKGNSGQKRKLKDRQVTPQHSTSNAAEDSKKVLDKRKITFSPKGSSIQSNKCSKKKMKTGPSSSTKVKGNNSVKKYGTDVQVTEKYGKDVRRVISSSEASLCSFKDVEVATHKSELQGKPHLTDPVKLKSIQSWIDQCEPEENFSDKSSDILLPHVNISFHDQDSGLGSGSYVDCRRVVMATDKLSVSTGDSAIQDFSATNDSSWKGPKSGNMAAKNNSWKDVHSRPATVTHRNILDMEIDEVQTELVATESREIEDMDVAIIALKEVRVHLQKQSPTEVFGSLTERISVSDDQANEEHLASSQKLLIVIDTNVLIDHVGFVEELRDQVFKELDKPILVIPWVVMQELDALKNSESNNFSLATAKKARASVNFLFHCFQIKHPRVRGQTPKEGKEAMKEFKAECNDDRILHCCLQCQKKFADSHVILLTNDKNLCTKATILGVKAYTKQTISTGLDGLSSLLAKPKVSTGIIRLSSPTNSLTSPGKSPQVTPGETHQSCNVVATPANPPATTQTCSNVLVTPDSKEESFDSVADQILCKAKMLMKNSLSIVLEKEMKVAYDDLWSSIVLRKPPWTLEDILECFKKHWMAVFGMIYNRKLRQEVHRLVDKFKPFKCFTPTLDSVGEVVTDAVKILEECNSHSNYGILFRESFAELKEVQKFQRDCKGGTATATSLDTFLKRKESHIPKPKKTSSLDSNTNTSTSHQHSSRSPHVRSVTPQSAPSSHTSPCVSDSGSVDPQVVENRFRNIWQTITSLCNTMEEWVKSGQHVQQMHDLLTTLVPFVKDLRFQYEETLRFSPAQIMSQKANVHKLWIKLNTFYSTMQIEEIGDHVDMEQLQMYFANEERRELLKAGLRQLDDMIRQIITFVHLLPD